MDEHFILGISLIILLILTLMYEPPIQEGLDIGKEIQKTFEKPAKDIKKATTKEFNKAKKETTKGFNVVKKGTEKLGKDITKGFDDIFAEVTNIFNYIACAFDKIRTLPDCFFWYFLDIIYGVIYMFYSMLSAAIPPLKDAAKLVGEAIKTADKFIFDMTGFHIAKYPQPVLKKCYLCKSAPKKKRGK
jgi:hypothetical protein